MPKAMESYRRCLLLVDEGRIELDAPIGDYLPGLITNKVERIKKSIITS